MPHAVVDGWWLYGSQVPPGHALAGAPPPEGAAVWVVEQASGLRDGPYSEWWPREDPQAEPKLRRQGVFVDGEQVGEWILWHPNGRQRRLGKFKDGLEEGRFVTWFETGQIESEGRFVGGRRDGLWVWWRPDKARQKHREATYVMGRPHGRWTEWFIDGQTSLMCDYAEGKRHGPYRTWHRNGRVAERGEYWAGDKHLTWERFDERGDLLASSRWVHGRRIPD
ncbi:MAG: hypothetical protein KC613_24820 [Myxococcales bacterium]|nr:hypothetical protein [Myxococcales bacterium]MCB9524708.1 hypothetical protein [Myxococcales bacterium]